MHDGVIFEDHGIPTATVVSAEFVGAARAQAHALGITDYRPVVVAHPLQLLTREEVQKLADRAFDEVIYTLNALTTG